MATVDAERLKTFIRREFLFDRDAEVSDDLVLFPELIDSLGLLDLVAFIEDTYDVVIDDDELLVDNFRTMADITELLERKSAGGST